MRDKACSRSFGQLTRTIQRLDEHRHLAVASILLIVGRPCDCPQPLHPRRLYSTCNPTPRTYRRVESSHLLPRRLSGSKGQLARYTPLRATDFVDSSRPPRPRCPVADVDQSYVILEGEDRSRRYGDVIDLTKKKGQTRLGGYEQPTPPSTALPAGDGRCCALWRSSRSSLHVSERRPHSRAVTYILLFPTSTRPDADAASLAKPRSQLLVEAICNPTSSLLRIAALNLAKVCFC